MDVVRVAKDREPEIEKAGNRPVDIAPGGLNGSAYFLASRTMLNGVSAARRT